MINIKYSNENETISFYDYDSWEDLIEVLAKSVNSTVSDLDIEEKISKVFPTRELYYSTLNSDLEIFDRIDLDDFNTSFLWDFMNDFNSVLDYCNYSNLAILYYISELGHLPDSYEIEDIYNTYIGEFDSDYEAGKYYIREIMSCPHDIENLINDLIPNFYEKVAYKYLYNVNNFYFLEE